jgi:hypothetical protein
MSKKNRKFLIFARLCKYLSLKLKKKRIKSRENSKHKHKNKSDRKHSNKEF